MKDELAAVQARWDDHEAKMIQASLSEHELKVSTTALATAKGQLEAEVADLKPRLLEALSKLAGVTAENADLRNKVRLRLFLCLMAEAS